MEAQYSCSQNIDTFSNVSYNNTVWSDATRRCYLYRLIGGLRVVSVFILAAYFLRGEGGVLMKKKEVPECRRFSHEKGTNMGRCMIHVGVQVVMMCEWISPGER